MCNAMHARSSLVRGFGPSYAEVETVLQMVLQNHPSSLPHRDVGRDEGEGRRPTWRRRIQTDVQFFRTGTASSLDHAK